MNTIVTPTLRLLPLTFFFWWPSALAAQGGLTLSGAIASWDLAGTGTGTTVAIRWDHRLADLSAPGPLSLELGLGWFQDGQAGQGAVDLLLPEAGLAVGLPGPFYLGVGAGWAIGLEDRNGDDLTLWSALGAQVPVAGVWSLRPEIRVRAVDPWVGTVADFALGVRRGPR